MNAPRRRLLPVRRRLLHRARVRAYRTGRGGGGALRSGSTRTLCKPSAETHEGTAALGLSEVEFRGPLAAHYVLPRGATYFGAEARLPEPARAWGDCVLSIRDNDREIFTATLNAETPTALIGVRLTGSTLTVEVAEGSGGPIQDRVVLVRAMVLVEE